MSEILPADAPKLRVPENEKVTINLGYVDLGHIDLLVAEGFYSNRTDFIRTAIRNQLQDAAKRIEGIEPDQQYTDSAGLQRAAERMVFRTDEHDGQDSWSLRLWASGANGFSENSCSTATSKSAASFSASSTDGA